VLVLQEHRLTEEITEVDPQGPGDVNEHVQPANLPPPRSILLNQSSDRPTNPASVT
jgi:hypothetical protein